MTFVDSWTVRDDDYVNNWAEEAEENNGYRPPRRNAPGSEVSVYQSFETQKGDDFEEEIKFVYARPWELHGEFPSAEEHLTMAQHTTVNVVGRRRIEHHFECFDFNIVDVLPSHLDIRAGDWIRLVLKENPTTGYMWRTNAKADGPLVELYNNYQLPNTNLLGASGTRVLILQAKQSTYLQIGIANPGQLSEEGIPVNCQECHTVELIDSNEFLTL